MLFREKQSVVTNDDRTQGGTIILVAWPIGWHSVDGTRHKTSNY